MATPLLSSGTRPRPTFLLGTILKLLRSFLKSLGRGHAAALEFAEHLRPLIAKILKTLAPEISFSFEEPLLLLRLFLQLSKFLFNEGPFFCDPLTKGLGILLP